uniref:Putative secreted protein n=1 Tax=Anopheles marajoara TaxID=58244 RepID=A0A2M4CD45_9DIPT
MPTVAANSPARASAIWIVSLHRLRARIVPTRRRKPRLLRCNEGGGRVFEFREDARVPREYRCSEYKFMIAEYSA